MVTHWFKGVSTYNGQPLFDHVLTLCKKPARETNEDGDVVRRIGACHPYQVTCKKCKEELEKQS